MWRLLVVGLLVGRASAQSVRYVPAGPNLPFSSAVVVDKMIYVAGQIGNVPATGAIVSGGVKTETAQVPKSVDALRAAGAIVPGGVKAETAQALKNIDAILHGLGSSLDHVVKCTVMLADIQEWPAMNEVYVTFFPNHLPARSAFATAGLVRGVRVEIECMATVSQ
jgi:2-iminobutanoate/2-iminopropanoate deaminase